MRSLHSKLVDKLKIGKLPIVYSVAVVSVIAAIFLFSLGKLTEELELEFISAGIGIGLLACIFIALSSLFVSVIILVFNKIKYFGKNR